MDSPQEQGVPPPPTTTAPTIGEISKTSLTLPYLGNDDDVERTDRVNVQPNIDHPPHLEIESMYVPSMVEEEYIHVESERRHPRPNKTTTFASTFTSSLPSKTKNHPHYLPRSPFQHRDKVVGLKDAATKRSVQYRRQEFLHTQHSSMDTLAGGPTTPTMTKSIEDKERLARGGEITNPLSILFLGNLAAFKVMIFYLITAETIVTCMLTAGMIIYWYSYGLEDHLYENPEGISSRLWSGSGMDFVVLIFAVTSPIATAISMAFTRREESLVMISEMRSSAHHIYLAHALWDWPEGGGRAGCKDFDFLEHCDAVLAQLVGIGDELSRFLTLPTTSRSRHRMTKGGRREAARTIEVAYALLESMLTQRMTRLTVYSERIKRVGLPAGEVSRIRQYERYLQTNIERLRMYKMYRTPQALRSFARIFTLLLPPFYAPKFAQVAIDVQSLGIGLSFGLITAIGLTALFESLQVLEDPFVGYLALDGIDVKEEFEVLLWTTLVKTRQTIFPNSHSFPTGRRTALKVFHHSDRRPSQAKPTEKLSSMKPPFIQITTPPSSPVQHRGSSNVSTSHIHPTDPNVSEDSGIGQNPATTYGTLVEKADSGEISVLSDQSIHHEGHSGVYDSDDAVEFGHRILEDPEMEEVLRQTNFRHDGLFVHHERKSTRSLNNVMGLVFRNNAGAGAGGGGASL